MHVIHESLTNNEYINSATVVNWFPVFFNNYCQDDSSRGNKTSSSPFGDDDGGAGFWEYGAFSSSDLAAEDCTDGQQHCHCIFESSSKNSCISELYFKNQFLNFLNENRNFFADFKFNVQLENMSYVDLLNGEFSITVSYIILKGIRMGCFTRKLIFTTHARCRLQEPTSATSTCL